MNSNDTDLDRRGIFDIGAYTQGVNARQQGQHLNDNPFRGTHARYCWSEGWKDEDKKVPHA